MSTIFYDHLIPWHKVDLYIQTVGLAGEERIEIIELIEETIHTETLLVILHHLPAGKHEEFVEKFHAAPHDKEHLTFLKQHGHPEIEQRIKEAAEKIITELLTELESEEDSSTE
jgi:hypothetical protein